MRKIYNILFALLSVVALAACSNDVDEVFDKSSAQRVNEALAEYKTVLCSAENGWLMKYYPKENTQYGGYNVLLKFDESGNVTAMSDVYGSDVEATSHYTLGQSAGILLSFDEYNKVIHFFSDPVNPAGAGNNGKGMEGDLEFRVLTATPDSVVMLGKKRGAKIVMTPMAKDASWGDYIDQIGELEDEMYFPVYNCEVNGAKYSVTTSYRTMTFTRTDEEADQITTPYIVTDKGLEFYNAVSLNGEDVKGFGYVGGDTHEFDATSGDLKMYGIIIPLSAVFTSGDWFFSMQSMGSYSKAYWNACKQISQERVGEDMTYAYIGTSTLSKSNGKYGFVFVSGNAYAGCLYYNVTPVDDDHVTLKFALGGDSNGVWYYNNAGYDYILYALSGSAGKTYSIEADDAKRPSMIKLTDVSNPNNWYILTSNAPSTPY